jgi:hypothetical protein
MRLPQFISLLISLTKSTSADPWPVKLLESLRGDKKIDQGGYDQLVKHGRDVIQGRVASDLDFKRLSLIDDFIALFGPVPFPSRLSDAVKTLVSFSCASNKSEYVQGKLVKQGVLSKSQDCIKGPLIIQGSKCPVDGSPFEPISLDNPRADTSGSLADTSKSQTQGRIPTETWLAEIKIKYPQLFLEDCVYSKNIDQIMEDAQGIPIAEILVSKIQQENQRKRPFFVEITGSGFAVRRATELVGGFISIGTVTWMRNLLISELTQVIDICSEVSFVYSSFGLTTIGLPRLSKKVIPFHYYQGLTTTCYYLFLFSRTGVPATYPPKFQVYNMLAAIVEDVNGIPLGNSEVLMRYYERFFKASASAIHVHYLPDQEIPSSEEIAGAVNAFMTSTGVASVGELTGAILPIIWPFISTHGHQGLVAVFSACYILVSQLPPDEETKINGFSYVVSRALSELHAADKILDMMKIAQELLDSPEWNQ